MEVIARREAAALGRKRFYTGRPCKRGHDCERYVISGACCDCVNIKVLPPPVDPVESVTLSNGRVVRRIDKDEAHRLKWSVYFTGLPCTYGHVAERRVKDDMCIVCANPPTYGPRGVDGWLAFQPDPPLAVPPSFPTSLRPALAKRLQDAIPDFIKDLSPTTVLAQSELLTAYDVVLQHTPAPDQFIEGRKTWWRYMGELPGCPHDHEGEPMPWADPYRREFYAHDKPWVFKDGAWFIVHEGRYEAVLRDGFDIDVEASWVAANP